MARRLRVEFAGAIYHVTCRLAGSWRMGDRALFIDEHDRWRFLDQLGERVECFEVVLHQYVLMRNHFHLVIETPHANCSAFMQAFLTAYTVYFNLRHDRHGHVLDGRYKAKPVQGDEYLLALSRYVHLNPVRVGEWRDADTGTQLGYLGRYYWSSYLQYIGRRKKMPWLRCGPTLALMGGQGREQMRRYRRFVEDGIAVADEEFADQVHSPGLALGDEVFTDRINNLYGRSSRSMSRPEDVAFRHVGSYLSPQEVLKELAAVLDCRISDFQIRRRSSVLRPFAARFLTRFAGLDQRAVAGLLGLKTGAAVSAQIKRFAVLLEESRCRRRQAGACQARLKDLLRSQRRQPDR